jgi:hypothetical protein
LSKISLITRCWLSYSYWHHAYNVTLITYIWTFGMSQRRVTSQYACLMLTLSQLCNQNSQYWVQIVKSSTFLKACGSNFLGKIVRKTGLFFLLCKYHPSRPLNCMTTWPAKKVSVNGALTCKCRTDITPLMD